MSYRNITVDNKQYQYVVGKEFVKIKGIGFWERFPDYLAVKPSNIVDLIKRQISKVKYS